MICTEDQVLHIEWTVADKYGRDIESNIIQWSCENRNFDNTANPENTTQPFKTSFDISTCVGIVYFRVKIRIGTSFFYGDEEATNNSECLSSSSTAVRASWCGDCPDTVITPPVIVITLTATDAVTDTIITTSVWVITPTDTVVTITPPPVTTTSYRRGFKFLGHQYLRKMVKRRTRTINNKSR